MAYKLVDAMETDARRREFEMCTRGMDCVVVVQITTSSFKVYVRCKLGSFNVSASTYISTPLVKLELKICEISATITERGISGNVCIVQKRVSHLPYLFNLTFLRFHVVLQVMIFLFNSICLGMHPSLCGMVYKNNVACIIGFLMVLYIIHQPTLLELHIINFVNS